MKFKFPPQAKDIGVISGGAVAGAISDHVLDYASRQTGGSMHGEIIPGVRVFGVVNTVAPLAALPFTMKRGKIPLFLAGWFASGLALQVWWATAKAMGVPITAAPKTVAAPQAQGIVSVGSTMSPPHYTLNGVPGARTISLSPKYTLER